MEEGRGAVGEDLGRQRQEGRRQPRCGDERAQGRTGEVQSGLLMNDATRGRSPVDRFIDLIEVTAAGFLAVVTLLVFVSVFLRYFFAWSIPDSYDFTRLLLGILIFWGMAVASYRGGHISVDLLGAGRAGRAER